MALAHNKVSSFITDTAMTTSRLTLPPFFFNETGGQSLALPRNRNNDDDDDDDDKLILPSELLVQVLAFGSWGDHAKLACVQGSWTNLLLEVARHSGAQWELAQIWLGRGHEGADLQRHPERAVQLLRELAAGDGPQTNDNAAAEAMQQIAHCCFTGLGVEINSALGVEWLERSFAAGCVDAAHELAMVYEFGKHGVAIDVVAAAQWLERAAKQSHLESMAELALCYELGCGVEQSDEHALAWYMKAAERGHLTARFSVGEAFEEARGVPQSDTEACLWYYKAAVQGDEDSRQALRRLADIARIVLPGVADLLDG